MAANPELGIASRFLSLPPSISLPISAAEGVQILSNDWELLLPRSDQRAAPGGTDYEQEAILSQQWWLPRGRRVWAFSDDFGARSHTMLGILPRAPRQADVIPGTTPLKASVTSLRVIGVGMVKISKQTV